MDMRGWAVLLLLTGCASQLAVTVQTHPPGAQVSADGVNFGPAPVVIPYGNPPAFAGGGCVVLNPITATWVSGAQVVQSPTICKPQHGMTPTLNMARGAGPGMEVDANYALRLQQTQLLERSVSNQEFMSGWQMGKDIYPKNTTPRETHCTSRTIGGTTRTSCY